MKKTHSEEYRQLLDSWQWKYLRAMVFNRDDYTCRHCGIQIRAPVRGRWLECDHKTYPKFGSDINAFLRQPLSDYQTLCNLCHQQKTNTQKRKKSR